ncbi:uncharacterized protein PAC_14994 [Phialocephala subalpina]|uniref:Uncharacterized protein n=1 Tax=Phialocephala subalpina TaxID=576137 RepID=A0A1L7XJA2_9HELO|nr:uncharacterized protein PAC_14994 [Phialocephala subalpina]
MDPYDSDSGTEDWEFGDSYDLDDDRSVLRPGRQALGIGRNYVPSWKPAHAIREFYQNWKDAIVEAAGLQQKDLCPVVKGFDAKEVYIVEARHPETNDLLGFIRFKNGTLEFTNFNAQLSRGALDIGGTSKRDNPEAAGTHGEGFKIASLVMARRGYRVQYEASEYYWTMKFAGRDENVLYCFLTKMSESKVLKVKEKYQAQVAKGSDRQLQNNIWEDVSVKIGKIRGAGCRIEKVDFLKWIDVSLDLNRPSKMIETHYGNLIMDDSFKGRVYLKGLLLENFSTEKPFRFGYNFFDGAVNRDRERLTNSNEEAGVLAHIWAAAIQSNEHDALESYVSMLRDDTWADVHETEAYVSESTAMKIWEQLLELDPDKKQFYHDSRNGDEDVEIIRNSLKKKPAQLPAVLWDPLRRFRLVRTPQEQQCYLLHNAPVAEDNKTTYSRGVQRALRASLALDARAKDLEIIFKRGDRTDLDLLLIDGALEINDKWLDFGLSHDINQCWVALQFSHDNSTPDHFCCDHIVTELFSLIVNELKRQPLPGEHDVIEIDPSINLKVYENLRHMPVMVKARALAEAVYGIDPKCRVVLHRDSTCSVRRDELLVHYLQKDDAESTTFQQSEDTCGCPVKIVSRKDFQAVFQTLDPKETYFPMVSRAEHRAFFGLPPASISPRSSKTRSQPEPRRGVTATQLPCTIPTQMDHKVENGGLENNFGDLYGVSDSEDAIVVDVPSSKRTTDSNSVNGQGSRPPASSNSVQRRPTVQGEPDPLSKANQNLQVAQAEIETQKNLVHMRDQTIHELSTTISKQKELPQTSEIDLWNARIRLLEQKDHACRLLMSRDEQIKDKDQALSEAQLRFDVAATELLSKQEEMDARSEEMKAKDRTLREAQFQIDKAATELLSMQGQIEAGLEQIKDKDRELSEAQLLLGEATTELQSKQEQLETIQRRAQLHIDEAANLQREEEDASGIIEDLRNKIQQLQDVKEDLEARLKGAEYAYDAQVKLAKLTAERRQRHTHGIKREIDEDEDNVTIKSEGSSSKRQRTIITIAQEGVVDLTDD